MKSKIGKKTIIVISFITVFLSLELIYIWLDRSFFGNETYSNFKNIPSLMEIDEVPITMTSYLWRDFMPSVGEERNHALICAITLTTDISSDLLIEIHVKKFWAISAKSIWNISQLEGYIFESDYRINENKDKLEIIIRNGPNNDLWQEGTLVDVILQFRYGLDFYYLQSNNVPIVYTS